MKSIQKIVLRFLAVFVVLASLVTAEPAFGSDGPRRTLMAVDTTRSSTYIADQPSADAAARYVEKYISGLDQPHELRMISVGEVGRGNRTIDISATVTNHRASSAKSLAAAYGGYFRALTSSNIKEGASTSLIQFFQSLETVCAKAPTKVIVFTDGLEWSSTVDGRAFARGAVGLPTPERPFLAGCQVEMNGIGELRSSADSDGLEQRLVPQWTKYLKAAGADQVVVTGSFFDF